MKFIGGVSRESIQWGGHTDPTGILDVGKDYKVERIDVHSYHTRIYLVGISGYFNSVWFDWELTL